MEPQKFCIHLLLVRHGETEDNKTKTIAGQRPGKLTALGIQQAQKIGQYFSKESKEFDYIYVSDLGRTKETFANALLKYPKMNKIKTTFCETIRERSGGILEGSPLTIWAQNAKKENKNIREYKCKGGESWVDVMNRAFLFLKLLITNHLMEPTLETEVPPCRRVLAVTHGGFIMEFYNMLLVLEGNAAKLNNTAKNCSMHEFKIEYYGEKEYEIKKVKVECILDNFVGHL